MVNDEHPQSAGTSISELIWRGLGLAVVLTLFGLYAYGAYDVAVGHMRPDAMGMIFLAMPSTEFAFVLGGALVAFFTRRPNLALRWSVQALGYLLAFDLVIVFLYVYAYGVV